MKTTAFIMMIEPEKIAEKRFKTELSLYRYNFDGPTDDKAIVEIPNAWGPLGLRSCAQNFRRDESMKMPAISQLENIYHRGQEKIWNGREVLTQLVEKHGGVEGLPLEKKYALQNIFAVILEGEDAAWKISLQLAESVSSVEARMAATSQAHDEARHFLRYARLSGIDRL